MTDNLVELINTPHDPIMLLFIGATEGAMVFYAFQCLLTRNNRPNWQYALAMVIYIACTIFDAYNNFPIYFVMIICYLLITFIAVYFYDDPPDIRLLVPFIFVAVNYGSTIVSAVFVWGLRSGLMEAYPPNLRMDYATQMILCIIFAVMIQVLMFLRKRLGRQPRAQIAMWVIFPLLLLITVFNLYYMGDYEMTDKTYEYSKLLVALTLFLIAVILFMEADRAAKLHEANSHSASLEQLVSVQEKYYLSMQEHHQKLRRLSHDIKNHNRAIHGLISQGKYKEAMEYSETIVQETEVLSPVTECRNVIIGAMLNDRFGNIKNEGVDISLCIMVPEVLTIKDSDMCILLGNLFDNAVEACRNDDVSEKKFIDVDIRLKGPLLCIKVRNSYSGNIRYMDHHYLTTKADEDSHGIGLTNVRRVVEKYDGRTTIDHTNNVFSVTAIMIYPSESEDE